MAGPSPIAGVAMVGSEADVIEAFVRHHLPLLDRLVLVVHHPLDETRPILESLVAEGLSLELREARHAAFRQAEEVAAVARELLAGGAGFVVLLDADEFLKLPDPGYLRRALPALPPGRFGALRWQSYVPLPGDDAREANPVRRIRHRRRDEGVDCFKVILTPDFLREEHFLLEGHHCVMRREEGGTAAPAPMTELKAVRLAHFPVRSRAQFEAKVVLGTLRKRAAPGADPALGAHWRANYEAIRDGAGLDAAALARIAVRYAFPGDPSLDVGADGLVADPLPADYALRYPAGAQRGALSAVLRWLEARAASREAGA
ncbi:MAG: glycosyltransferase family 2 protein [Burkholderiales bacterium]|nr:glycosyltransferase family 2 protein [Burkholderiales bacterium]